MLSTCFLTIKSGKSQQEVGDEEEMAAFLANKGRGIRMQLQRPQRFSGKLHQIQDV